MCELLFFIVCVGVHVCVINVCVGQEGGDVGKGFDSTLTIQRYNRLRKECQKHYNTTLIYDPCN